MNAAVRSSLRMFTKRLSVSATVKQQPSSTITKSTNGRSMSTDGSVQHYNDWPNAVGFDTTYEEHEPVDLPVQGHIPAYAAGTLFRTAIGPRTVANDVGKPAFKANHWFDGFSQVHRFQLHTSTSSEPKAGIERVSYNSRLTSDQLIEQVRKTGKLDEITFAANYEPCKSFFQKVQAVFEKAPDKQSNEVNNAVTMSINYPGLSATGSPQSSPHTANKVTSLCNKTDAARMQFLDPQTLKPTSLTWQAKLNPLLKGVLSGAHPETDSVTGDTFNYNLDFGSRNATYRVFRTAASTGHTSILATISYPPAYLHSLFLTEHFVVLCIWNSHFTKAGASILWNRNMLDSMYFNKSPAMWYVIDRRCPDTENGKGIVAKFESDPFFAFHTVNAYEVPSTNNKDLEVDSNENKGNVDLICDVCAFKNTDVIHHYYMDNLVSSNPASHSKGQLFSSGRYDHIKPELRRYRLSSVPVPTDTSSSSSLPSSNPSLTPKATLEFTAPTSKSMDLPIFNPHHATKPYRYIYGIFGLTGSGSTFVDGLLKYDLHTHEITKWEKRGHTPGEAIFIPNPNPSRNEDGGVREDDGVLLTVVLDGYSSKSYLLCLDARDMSELGRAEVAGVVGFGFHGVHTSVL